LQNNKAPVACCFPVLLECVDPQQRVVAHVVQALVLLGAKRTKVPDEASNRATGSVANTKDSGESTKTFERTS